MLALAQRVLADGGGGAGGAARAGAKTNHPFLYFLAFWPIGGGFMVGSALLTVGNRTKEATLG